MEQVYKNVELTGSSKESMEKAIENAIERAAKTIRHMRWFEVLETRGFIEDGKVAYYQVTIKIGFTVDNPDVA